MQDATRRRLLANILNIQENRTCARIDAIGAPRVQYFSTEVCPSRALRVTTRSTRRPGFIRMVATQSHGAATLLFDWDRAEAKSLHSRPSARRQKK